MTTASRTDDETVMLLCAHSQHMTTMNGYALQRHQRQSMLDATRARRRQQEDDDDAKARVKAQAKAAEQETQTLLAEHRQWNARRDAFKGGWKHFG